LAFPELVERYGSELTAQIPPHCLEAVAQAAAECAAAWEAFASNTESMQSVAARDL
jgi:hypothetical protein